MSKQQGFVLWMTGLSGAGKTTVALEMLKQLEGRSLNLERLDGDVVRESLTKDLGFTAEDRRTNIERITFVAKLLSRNEVGCICSFISPYQSVRDHVRENTTNFLELFIDAPLEVVIDRDVKGLYVKALAGEIPNFTGVSDPFEAPENPDIHVRTDQQTVEESAAYIISELEKRGLIPVTETA
ncbi:MAG: adenylyl-sulfate kinase [Chloroflexi bacterium]|nr:adenylyl-sulfate kinase [Chloroflexota bacterium]